jgi:cell division protein FtsI/penicillin-binding protein 2
MNRIISKKKDYKIGSRCELSEKNSRPQSKRIFALFFLIFLVSGAIGLKLYSLQVSAYSYYKALADNQHSIFSNLIPKRGEIFFQDKSGPYPVAVNKNTQMAYAVPKEIEDSISTAKSLSQALGLDEKDLENKLGNPDDSYEVLKHKLSDEEIASIKNLKLSGVHLADEAYRYYPAGELGSNLLGFVGWSGNDFGGRYGAEAYFDSVLKGKAGQLQQSKDNSGSWISTGEKQITLATDGDSLVFSVDHIIQYETEKILKSAIQKFEADRGTIIVMESQTGRILAMASAPDFNPNDYQNVDAMENFRNLAVSDPYECGSVFKAITMASAIDDGKVNPDTTYTDTGSVKEAGYDIKNSDLKANGVQTMTQVLEKSLNTGAIFAEKLLGNKNFAAYVERFGFGEPTGVELPGESAGNLNNLQNLKSNIQFFTASFGQGITVTPIQLISAYNAIANGGVLLKPELVEKIIHPDASVEDVKPQEVRQVISQNSANEVSQMLRSVVTDGHGKQANVPGYLVAGKTGTAQVASHDTKGYASGTNIGSFAGFAPMNNPQFTVLVRMDNPKTVAWAESSAAPTFGELMKFLLDYKNIEPTESYTQKDIDAFNLTHTLSQNFISSDNNNGNDSNKSSINTNSDDKKR